MSKRRAPSVLFEEERPVQPRKVRGVGQGPKRKSRKLTPLQRFRAQTITRKRALQKQIRDNNVELRQIIRDLGTLKRKPTL